MSEEMRITLVTLAISVAVAGIWMFFINKWVNYSSKKRMLKYKKEKRKEYLLTKGSEIEEAIEDGIAGGLSLDRSYWEEQMRFIERRDKHRMKFIEDIK